MIMALPARCRQKKKRLVAKFCSKCLCPASRSNLQLNRAASELAGGGLVWSAAASYVGTCGCCLGSCAAEWLQDLVWRSRGGMAAAAVSQGFGYVCMRISVIFILGLFTDVWDVAVLSPERFEW